MTTIVKRSATRVIGEIRGTNVVSYQFRPMVLSPIHRVAIPATNGIPR